MGKYRVLFEAEIIDPEDPEFIKTGEILAKESIKFGCISNVETKENIESGYLEFPSEESVDTFRTSPKHRQAMANVGRYYKWMKVKRDW